MDKMNTLKVTLFDAFQMELETNGQVQRISDQISSSKKLWYFLQYLVIFRHKKYIPQSEIIDTLWNNDEESNPANALKTLLHRARNTMEGLGYPDGKQVILYRRGMYSWNEELPLEIDAEKFESLCNKANGMGTDALPVLLEAIEVYKGDFLPKYSVVPWVIALRTYYQNRYQGACCDAIEILEQQQRYQEIISLCRKALAVIPYEECIHLKLVKALTAVGEQRLAIEHYAQTANMFMDELGVTPSEEFSKVYLDLIKVSQGVQLDLSVIRDELVRDLPAEGPYFCELAVFQEIYRRETRVSQRSGNVMQLALISVMDGRNKKLTPKQVSITMNRLKESLESILRRGDAFTRYSQSQYLLLLPYATYEGGEIVLQRALTHFKNNHPKTNATLHCSVMPMIPLPLGGKLPSDTERKDGGEES